MRHALVDLYRGQPTHEQLVLHRACIVNLRTQIRTDLVGLVGVVSQVVEKFVKIGESGVLHYCHGGFRVNEVVWLVVVLGQRYLAVDVLWVYPASPLVFILVGLGSFCAFLTFVAFGLFAALGRLVLVKFLVLKSDCLCLYPRPLGSLAFCNWLIVNCVLILLVGAI